MLDIPESVQHCILSFLCHKSLAMLEITCSHFKKYVSAGNHWQELCKRHLYYSVLSSLIARTTWKDFYCIMCSYKAPRKKRLLRDLKDLLENPMEDIISCIPSPDLDRCTVAMKGPAGSLYEGGVFKLGMTIPPDFPFKPPNKICFMTPMYHCNISEEGYMCLDSVEMNVWTPQVSIKSIFREILELLRNPNAQDPVRFELSTQWRHDPILYENKVREHVRQHSENKNM